MLSYCGKLVGKVGMVCGGVVGISPALLSINTGLGKNGLLIPTLSNFCTQFLHTQRSLFTPVINELFAFYTVPIIMTTRYIKE